LTKKKPSRPITGFSIVKDIQTFIERFHLFTYGIFRELDKTLWKNIAILGGSVLGSLLEIPSQLSTSPESITNYYQSTYPSSDIDLYLYDLNHDATQKKLHTLCEYFAKQSQNKFLVLQSQRTINFLFEYPFRPIQIQLGIWNDPLELLINTDIDCTGVAFTEGSQLLCTPRSLLSITHQWNMVSMESWKIRGSPSYEKRLVKYAKRGFSVVDLNYESYKDILKVFLDGKFPREKDDMLGDSYVGLKNLYGANLIGVCDRFPLEIDRILAEFEKKNRKRKKKKKKKKISLCSQKKEYPMDHNGHSNRSRNKSKKKASLMMVTEPS